MKRIAIVTGATGGIGKEFVRQFAEKSELDEIWAIGRNEKKLRILQQELGEKVKPMACDLGDEKRLRDFCETLSAQEVNVRYLVNNAGLAKMGKYEDFSWEEIAKTVDLNCKAVVLLSHFCISKMSEGSRILNLSSASSFQPNPYLALYSATKVFEKNYSRALNYELRGDGITCTAVCPGWVDTELLKKEYNGKVIRFPGIVSAKRVVRLAISDADKGKDMSVCSLFVKYEHLLSKITPHRLVMKLWAKGIERYVE